MVVVVAWVGFSVRAAAPCRTRTTHPDAARRRDGSRNRRRKRARGKYGRAAPRRTAPHRFGKHDSPVKRM